MDGIDYFLPGMDGIMEKAPLNPFLPFHAPRDLRAQAHGSGDQPNMIKRKGFETPNNFNPFV